MRTILLLCLVAFPLPVFGDGQASIRVPLIDKLGGDVGNVLLIQTNHHLQITIKLRNLPPGEHAVHIYEGGTCKPPDFKSVGGDFNPTGKEHGFAKAAGHHAGDLREPVVVLPNRKGEKTFIVDYLSFFGKTPVTGHTVIVRARGDDQTTEPEGNSGDRLACGEILGGLKKYGDL